MCVNTYSVPLSFFMSPSQISLWLLTQTLLDCLRAEQRMADHLLEYEELTPSQATKVVHVSGSKDCKPRNWRYGGSWIQAHIGETGCEPTRCHFYHRNPWTQRLRRCNNAIYTREWKGCHVWAEGEILIVPGCSYCNGNRPDARGMYVAKAAFSEYLRVEEGVNCKCDR